MCNWTQYLPPLKATHSKVPVKDQNFRVQSSPSSSRPRTSVPGENKISKDDSLDNFYTSTKENLIKETPGDLSQNSNLGRLTTQAKVPQINSDNRSTCVQNFYTQQINFSNFTPSTSSQS